MNQKDKNASINEMETFLSLIFTKINTNSVK